MDYICNVVYVAYVTNSRRHFLARSYNICVVSHHHHDIWRYVDDITTSSAIIYAVSFFMTLIFISLLSKYVVNIQYFMGRIKLAIIKFTVSLVQCTLYTVQ